MVSNSLEQYQLSKWLVDSGVSCCDSALSSTFTKTTLKSVIVASGAVLSVLYEQMAVQIHDGCEWISTTIDYVLFVLK